MIKSLKIYQDCGIFGEEGPPIGIVTFPICSYDCAKIEINVGRKTNVLALIIGALKRERVSHSDINGDICTILYDYGESLMTDDDKKGFQNILDDAIRNDGFFTLGSRMEFKPW